MTQLYSDNVQENIDLVSKLVWDTVDNDIIADLTICQAILEGGLLNSPPSGLALKYNNLFGIKGRGTHDPDFTNLLTHEYYNGQMHEIYQKFAWNNSIEDSIKQHQLLFELERYRNLKEAQTIEQAAQLIYEDGYCTDPLYPKKLIGIYNRYINN